MNHILGGGTFTSRLFDEVREKRGLAYGIDSSIVNNEYSSALVISTATRSDRAAETLEVIRDEVKRMADERCHRRRAGGGQEVHDRRLCHQQSRHILVASPVTLVELQIDDLGIDYIERRVDLIEAVTLEEVQAAAQAASFSAAGDPDRRTGQGRGGKNEGNKG